MSKSGTLTFVRATAGGSALLLALAACGGSDSTGPSSLGAHEALQSLSLGITGISDVVTPGAPSIGSALGAIEPLLDHVTLNIGGVSHDMFGLGLRETFPAGTCAEDLGDFPGVTGTCTTIPVGVVLVFWESHTANRPPERIVLVATNTGAADFEPVLDNNGIEQPQLEGVAVYLEGENLQNAWLSESGNLTTNVAATGQSCAVPLPAFAKSGTCSVATFAEDGGMSLTSLASLTETAPLAISISNQTIHGLWQDITEIQPVSTASLRGVTPSQSRQSARAALLAVLGKFQKQARP
jgi:hypothetical protein